jgi:hypothetical protein
MDDNCKTIKKTQVAYNIQCLQGCVFSETEDTELGQKAKNHENKGFLSALVVPPESCVYCCKDC